MRHVPVHRLASASGCGALAAFVLALTASGPSQAAGDDPVAASGSAAAPSVHTGGHGRPATPPGAFAEAPRGFEVSAARNDDLKHNWPDGFPTGGTTVNDDAGGGTATASAQFPGPLNNGWIPYDASVAVGPNDVVVLVNASMNFYDKSGNLRGSSSFDTWWGASAGTPFDPKCFYDAAAGHFVILATSTGNGLANMYVSVSQTSDPTGAWWTYPMDWRYDGSTLTGNWGDFPGLGYDDSAVYVSANQYGGGTFKYAKVRVLKKSELYSGASLTFTDFINMKNADGTTAFTVKPARTYGTGGSSEFLVNTRPGGGSSVTLWRIDNAVTSPTMTRVANVAVGTYGTPPDAPQAGTRNLVDTGDCRTQEIVSRDGVVYTGFTERYVQSKRSKVAAVRFLKIGSTGGKLLDITYSGPTGVSYYYPAVTVGPTGAVAMGFNRSSSKEYISSNVVKMAAGASSFSPSALLTAGTAAMLQSRWGDYNAIDLDPDGSRVWVMNGVGTNSVWGTDITAVSVP